MSKCIVLDFEAGDVFIFTVDDTWCSGEIEDMLVERGYNLDAVEWMVTKKGYIIVE